MTKFSIPAILLLFGFVATIPAANWLISNFGTVCIPDGPCLIPVGFGLVAPSGVLVIGLALVLRDEIHEHFGAAWAAGAVLAGCIVSLAVSSPALALASGVAFLVSELADGVVYSRVRATGRALAVVASGVVGAALDSAVFVYAAFGTFEFSGGTTLAKLYASVAAAAWIATKARRRA